MNILYFDCSSGAAGDMILSALLDVDADETFVRTQLDALPLDGWRLKINEVTRSGLRARYAEVQVEDDQPARDYRTIVTLLEEAELHPEVRSLSLAVFERLARAEAKVHGTDLESVHLHEVAAVDAFIDIVGSAAALVSLGPRRVLASPLNVGGGSVTSTHGTLPVPPPAVAELVTGVPIRGGGERELLTPTGAAILTTFVESFGHLPDMRLLRTGYGAGRADDETPNVLRAFFGEPLARGERGSALLLEANLDDMSPELVPRAIEQLLAAGAYDAWVTPVMMKKGRPAFTLSALVPENERDRALDAIYRETTTFGVRISTVVKDELDRRWIEVIVEGQGVRVKQGLRGGQVVIEAPEYEDAVAAARATGLPLKEVFRLAMLAAAEKAPR